MSGFVVKKAVKEQRRARVFLYGPSGSGKTWTALTWALELGKNVGLIDTEHGSALAYAEDFDFQHIEFDPPYTIARYRDAIQAAVDAGCDVVVIDSISHAWAGRGGLLEQVDDYGRQHRGDTFGGWRVATPQHQDLIDAVTSTPIHVIATARAKTEHVYQDNDRGKKEVVKLGLQPIQRDGLEYEFDVVGELSVPENRLTVTKTRCSQLTGFSQEKPDGSAGQVLAGWLSSGAPTPTVEELRILAEADDQDLDSLLSLFGRVNALGLLNSPVTDEETNLTTLGELIKERGRRLRAVSEPAA